jgi:hypothetical protein
MWDSRTRLSLPGKARLGFPHPMNDASTEGNFAEQESLNYNAGKNAFS